MKKKIYSCMDDYDPNSILIEDALKKITKITKKIDSYEYVSLIESHDRILYENIKSKIKVPNYNNSFKVQCFDETKTKLEPEMDTLVTKGHSVSTIVKLSGIWFAGGKFGVSWELVQMKLTPKTAIQEYAFQDESDNDDDEVVKADNVEPNNDDEQNYVVDSDEDL